MRPFILIIIQIIIIHYSVIAIDNANQKLISNAFEVMGYSPMCVSSALSTCELSTKNGFSISVADLLNVMKKLIAALQRTTGNSSSLCSEGNITKLLEEFNSTSRESSRSLLDTLAQIEAILRNSSFIEDVNSKSIKELEKKIQDGLNCNNALKGSCQNVVPNVYTGKNCAELRARGDTSSGVRTVFPFGTFNGKPLQALMTYCDQTTDGGGWTVFQNRDALPVREDFYRPWNDYVTGFGDLHGEFWLGLDNIHAMVNSSHTEMRVDLEDYDGKKVWAKYGSFHVGNASTLYAMRISDYSGNAGDSLIDMHNGMKFSTYDQDNDILYGSSCSTEFRGAWWYKNCHASNLNGVQYFGEHASYADGINWHSFRGHHYSLKKTSMKFRPVQS